jgi:hypothetical protein
MLLYAAVSGLSTGTVLGPRHASADLLTSRPCSHYDLKWFIMKGMHTQQHMHKQADKLHYLQGSQSSPRQAWSL